MSDCQVGKQTSVHATENGVSTPLSTIEHMAEALVPHRPDAFVSRPGDGRLIPLAEAEFVLTGECGPPPRPS